MHQAEIIVLLLTAVGVLAVLAHKIALPYPIVLVLCGLALSFVPRLPTVSLNPDVVFYFILPALIYPAALFTSWRDFRRNLRPILLLAIGLVLATMFAVAWIAHSIVPALPWAAAFALGAIVSPPDAVAATAIIRRLGVPHRIQVILEDKSLVNDATALVALQFAIAALVAGLSGRRDGESCPVGPHRHGRGCCRMQNVSTDVPCVCNVIGGMWPRGLDSLGKPTLGPRSRFSKFRPEGASRYSSAPLVESSSSARQHDLAERMALPVRSILVKWMEYGVYRVSGL